MNILAGRFRRKADPIDAAQMTPAVLADQLLWPHWLRDSGSISKHGQTWSVATPEGWRVLLPGDWIVRDTTGALFPLADSLFGARYEATA